MKYLLALTLILNFLLVACSSPSKKIEASEPTLKTSAPTESSLCERKKNAKLLVVTTVAPLTNIVSNIAGDRVDVKGLIAEGTDSHTFLPRPTHTQTLAEADLILVNGLHLETPTVDLANSIKCKDTKVYELGNYTISQDQWIFDFSFPKEKGNPNPHLWVNTQYAMTYAKLAARFLSELDPPGQDYYETNLKNYLQRLDALDKVTREVVASIPPQNRKLLTYHDSWGYWAREYSFEVIGAIQPSSFQAPDAKDISRLTQQVKQVGVPAIFGSEVYSNGIEKQIANQAKVKTANTADDELPDAGEANAIEDQNPQHTYIGMMAANLRIIAANLGGKPELVNRLNTANVVGPTSR